MAASKNPGNRRGKPAAAGQLVSIVEGVVDPSPPEGLGERGALMWVGVWGVGRGFYAKSDAWAVEQFCKLCDLEANLEAQVAEDGEVTVGSTGQPVAHPALKLLLEVRKELRSSAKDLALNPRDRTMLGLAVSRGESEMERLLAKRVGRA